MTPSEIAARARQLDDLCTPRDILKLVQALAEQAMPQVTCANPIPQPKTKGEEIAEGLFVARGRDLVAGDKRGTSGSPGGQTALLKEQAWSEPHLRGWAASAIDAALKEELERCAAKAERDGGIRGQRLADEIRSEWFARVMRAGE